MKKILLASVGVFAASAFTAQAAEPVKLSISGDMIQYLGYADNDLDGYTNVDQQGDANIIFSGETRLDNGLTVGVVVDMNATQGEDSASAGANKNVKYAYGYLAGKYGKISLGQQQNVAALIHHSAPAFGLGAQDGDWMNWVVNSENRAVQTTYVDDDKAADKINIFTPVWNGLQAGFSYVPDTNIANTGETSMAEKYTTHAGQDASSGDLYAFGATYDNEFSNGVGLGVDVSYIIGNLAGPAVGNQEIKFSAIQTGANVTYAGFTVGGSYLNRAADGGYRGQVQAGDSWDVGVAYEAEPWGVSLSYFGSKSRAFVSGINANEDEAQAISLAGKYNVGPGVELNGTIARVDYDTDSNDNARDNQGWAVVTGVRVRF